MKPFSGEPWLKLAKNNQIIVLINSKFLKNQSFFFFIHNHCVKTVRVRSFSCPYFPAFGLNTERYTERFSGGIERDQWHGMR